MSNNSLSTAVGGICAVSVIIIIIIVLVKSLPDRKRTSQVRFYIILLFTVFK